MGTSSESVPETAPRKTNGTEFDDENQQTFSKKNTYHQKKTLKY